MATILKSTYVKKKRQVCISCKIRYRRGDLVGYDSVVIQPSFAWKPSSVITSAFHVHVELMEYEWPRRAVV